MELKLGKAPHTPDSRDLLFSNYVDLSVVLPQIPTFFGHENLIGNNSWGMLGNDKAGDCVWAGSDHETMLWTKEANKPAAFSAENTLSDYSAATGYDPTTGANDNGTVVRDALKYRQKIGVLDTNGERHKIGAYVALDPANRNHVKAAMYLFSAVGIGIRFPKSAMSQFQERLIWDVVSGSPIIGGHYVPLICVRLNHWGSVTWGRLQNMTVPFYRTYVDEVWVILSQEMLVAGKSIDGFNLAALQADLAILKAG